MRLLAAALLAASCAAPVATEVGASASVYRRSEGPLATSFGSSCAPGALSLDPRWRETEASTIRQAARSWEEAVGADLGPLPLADTPCTDDGVVEVPGCIARSASLKKELEDSSALGIVVWAPGVASDVLKIIALHEIGHWIGIGGHGASGIMFPRRRSGIEGTGLTEADIALWEDWCVR